VITSGVLIAVIVSVLLLVFRPEVKKLVDWIVGFKRLAKTADGFAVETREPTVAPQLLAERREEAIVVTPAEALPVVATSTDEKDEDNWWTAYFEKRYDDAIALLDAEASAVNTPEARLTSRGAIGYVKYEQNPQNGVDYFEQFIREYPDRDEPYHWYGLTYFWRDLYEKSIAIAERGIAAAKVKWRLWGLKDRLSSRTWSNRRSDYRCTGRCSC